MGKILIRLDWVVKKLLRNNRNADRANKDTLELSTKQKAAFMKERVCSIFPEYYLIKGNRGKKKHRNCQKSNQKRL